MIIESVIIGSLIVVIIHNHFTIQDLRIEKEEVEDVYKEYARLYRESRKELCDVKEKNASKPE